MSAACPSKEKSPSDTEKMFFDRKKSSPPVFMNEFPFSTELRVRVAYCDVGKLDKTEEAESTPPFCSFDTRHNHQKFAMILRKKNSAFFPFMNIHLAVKAFRGSLFKKQTTRIGGFCLGNRLVPSHLRIGFICERNFHPGRHQQKKSRKGKATYNFSVTPLTSSGCLSQAMDFLCCHCVAKNVSCCEVSSHSRSHLLLSQRNFLSFSCENEPTSAFASLEVLFVWCKDLHYPSAFDLNRFQYQPAS